MKKIIFLSLFLAVAFSFLFKTQIVLAAPPDEGAFIPIVRCEVSGNSAYANVPCDLCQVFGMIARIIKLILYYIIPPLAVVAFLVAGIFFLFGGGNTSQISKGRKILQITVLGILIAYAGWLIVNTIMNQLIDPNAWPWWKDWYKIPQCASEGTPQAPPQEVKPETIKLTCDPNAPKSPELDELISCVKNKIEGKRYKGVEGIRLGSIITGGIHTCEPPENPVKISCHYGGTSLNKNCNGIARAVDFGGPPEGVNDSGKTYEQKIRERIEYERIKQAAQDCQGAAYCEDSDGNRKDCLDENFNVDHIHVNDPLARACGCN